MEHAMSFAELVAETEADNAILTEYIDPPSRRSPNRVEYPLGGGSWVSAENVLGMLWSGVRPAGVARMVAEAVRDEPLFDCREGSREDFVSKLPDDLREAVTSELPHARRGWASMGALECGLRKLAGR